VVKILEGKMFFYLTISNLEIFSDLVGAKKYLRNYFS